MASAAHPSHGRLARLRERLAALEADALLVTGPENRRYLSGFTGSAGVLVITAGDAVLMTDFRYVEQAAAEAPAFRVVRHGRPDTDTLRPLLDAMGVRRLAYEPAGLTAADLARYREGCPGVAWVPAESAVEALRRVKDAGEVARIARAQALCCRVWEAFLPEIRPGVRERDLALELEFRIRRAGADDRAFPFIVVSGPRSSLPHGTATDRVIQPGDLVTFDFGAQVDGYHSDLTRTVVVGRASAEQRRIYELVLRAQEAGLAAIRAGVTGRDADAAAREIIAGAGHGDHFGHGLGHGVGLAVHEAPRMAPHGADAPLEAGAVVTVEPGIYVPGFGGVRIEDLVVVGDGGVENLTPAPKALLEL